MSRFIGCCTLEKIEGKLNAILNSIGDHVRMFDEDLNIIWANEAVKKTFGNGVIGKKCYEAYHQRKEPCEPYPCIALKTFKDGKSHTHETRITLNHMSYAKLLSLHQPELFMNNVDEIITFVREGAGLFLCLFQLHFGILQYLDVPL